MGAGLDSGRLPVLGRAALLALLGCCAALAGANPALGARGHQYARTIGWGVRTGAEELQVCTKTEACKAGKAGSGNGQFKEPAGVAVNEQTEDFYVVDKGNNRVEHFNVKGGFIGQFQAPTLPAEPLQAPETIAVDNSCVQRKLKEPECKAKDPSNGDVYVQDGNGLGHKRVIDKFDATGKYLGQLEFNETGHGPVQARAVAVDREGNLWVAVNEGGETKRIYKFTNAEPNVAGNPAFVQANGVLFLQPGLALDSAGNFYSGVVGGGEPFEIIAKLNPEGKLLSEAFDEEQASDVASELPSNDVYVDNITKIRRFDAKEPNGELERFGEGHLGEGSGLGVDSASREGQVYVADKANNDLVEFPLEEPGPPTVEAESASEVTANSAELQASVNPRGATSEYHFEYGPCASVQSCKESPYGKEAPVPEGVLGAPFDFEGHSVSAHPQDLLPASTYHFRVLAHNEKSGEGPTLGEEKVFQTQPAGFGFALPDARAWELVSPAQKHGALIAHIKEGVIQAALAGDALAYLTASPSEAEPEGYTNLVQVLARRTKGGWSSKDIALPHEAATGVSVGGGQEYRSFSEELSVGFVQPFGAFNPSISKEASEQTPYVRTNFSAGHVEEPCTSHCLQPIVKSAPHPFGEEGRCPPEPRCGPHVAGASPDGRHVVIGASVGLSEAPEDKGGLYEWSEGAGLTLVSVLPGGKPGAVQGLGSGAGVVRHAISADGKRIVWTGGGHLYLREVAQKSTLELDKGLAGTPIFQSASADDSKVFFLEEKPGPPGQEHDRVLYVYDTQAEKATLLTQTISPEFTAVQGGVIGASEDGSYLYLVANAKLSEGPGEEAVKGNCERTASLGRQCNLYELHEEGGAWQKRLVAVLAEADGGDWGAQGGSGILPGLTARVSPDGRHLAFMSSRSLSGYDNRDANSAKADQEVYEFDASQPRSSTNPACASCNPTGARPVGVKYEKLEEGLAGGNAVWEPNTWVAANVPAWTPNDVSDAQYQSRYLSNSGRLFFNSSDALVPQDVNGTEDVYQYEPLGVGGEKGCNSSLPTYSSRAGGCISLISSGSSREESAFLDASESGSDVFFLTAAKLVKEDFDTALDIYDAHECTPASPCIAEKAPPPPSCITESSCKASPTPQPEIFGAPASATFSGAGNIIAEAPLAKAPAKPTNAQLLVRALKSCKAKYRHAKKRREGCEAKARKRYQPKAKRTAAAKRANSASTGGRR